MNSSLLAAYASYDQRFHILGFFVKEWAKANEILGGDKQLPSSYAYLNLVIQYLQIIKPPVLPPLQKLFLTKEQGKEVWIKYPVPDRVINKEKEREYGEGEGFMDSLRNMKMHFIPTNVYFERDLQAVRKYMEKEHGLNYSTIAELINGFFKYYAYEFDVFHPREIRINRATAT